MRYRLCIIILFIFSFNKAFSQDNFIFTPINSIMLEVGGVGGYGSLNYERVFVRKNDWSFALRTGISTYHLYDYTNSFNPDILIPFSLNIFYGKKHKVVLGIGQTLANIVYADTKDFEPARKINFHSNFTIGYRYQKNLKGLFFQCSYTPIIELDHSLRHWAGISFGYSFAKKIKQ